jgi:hypothetical protein
MYQHWEVISMTSKTLKRSSSLLIMSGILLIIGILFHPGMSRPDAAASFSWGLVHVLLGFSALLALAGLGGLFAVMNLKLTGFGKAAFGLAMLGNVLLTGIMFFVNASVLPVLARDPAYLPLLSEIGPLMTGALGMAITISTATAALGYILMAGYLAVSKTISLANAVLFLGAPLMLFAPGVTFAFAVVGGLLLGAGITWLGLSIRRGIAHQWLASTLRVQDECLAHLGHA